MTRDDIIRMAREVGFDDFEQDYMLERFAALVAAAEREACARVCDTHTVDDVLVGVGIAQSCAAIIRARGEK